MVWFTDRWGTRMQAGWPAELDMRLGFFTEKAWDRWHLSEVELEQLKAREEKEKEEKGKDDAAEKDADDDKKKGKKAKDEEAGEKEEEESSLPDPVELDLENLEDRILRVTSHSSDMADGELTPDGETLVYLASFEDGYDLWSYKHRTQDVKLLAKINASRVGGLRLDAKGEKVFLLVDGGLRTVEVAGGTVKPVSLSASFELDAAAEREYMFEHVWRQTLKKFHAVDMHGVDWAFYKEAYQRFLEHIDTNADFAELLSEMLGELNASHTGGRWRPSRPNADATAALGFFPDAEWAEAGIRIAEILKKSPLRQTGTKIDVGTVITAIDGHEIAAGENWYSLLNRKAGEPVRLTLENPDTGKSWEERVKPVSWGAQNQMLYDRWVASRMAEVERLSDGRLGYAHIRGMGDGSFRVIFEDIFGDSLTKEAIVLDTRFNGGGNLDEALTVFLSGEVFMRAVPRGQEVGAVPDNRWSKPSIVIQNEGNYSDAHCFPNGYRSLGIGETVGMQVPGTCTAVWWERLQDREIIFGIPQVTWVDNDGDAMENKHFDPDYEVDNAPEIEAAGRDQQLEKAVEVLMEQLGGGE
jgi:C-terminal processing protease CtpA/Prc